MGLKTPWDGSPGSDKLAGAFARISSNGATTNGVMSLHSTLPLWFTCSTYQLRWEQPLPSHLYDFLDHVHTKARCRG